MGIKKWLRFWIQQGEISVIFLYGTLRARHLTFQLQQWRYSNAISGRIVIVLGSAQREGVQLHECVAR